VYHKRIAREVAAYFLTQESTVPLYAYAACSLTICQSTNGTL